MTIKFTFLLKSGKTFDCIVKEYREVGMAYIQFAKSAFKKGHGSKTRMMFEDCCVNLSECAVVSWEVLNEQKTEES